MSLLFLLSHIRMHHFLSEKQQGGSLALVSQLGHVISINNTTPPSDDKFDISKKTLKQPTKWDASALEPPIDGNSINHNLPQQKLEVITGLVSLQMSMTKNTFLVMELVF